MLCKFLRHDLCIKKDRFKTLREFTDFIQCILKTIVESPVTQQHAESRILTIQGCRENTHLPQSLGNTGRPARHLILIRQDFRDPMHIGERFICHLDHIVDTVKRFP